MQIEIQEAAPGITRVTLQGRLDTEGVDAVELRFNAALTDGGRGLIDLAGVTFLSSMGIRLLIGAAKAAHRRGGKLVLVGPVGLVAEALEHAAIDELIPVAADTQTAMARLEETE